MPTPRRVALLIAVVAVGVAVAVAVAPAGSSSTPPCHSVVQHGVLPTWARAGFSDPRPRMAHVLGRSGEIAAVVFGYPLRSPEGKDRGNKILWVSRRDVKPLSDLRIHAQRMDGRHRVGRPVTRVVVGGPGPSGINVPAPGCWRLRLRWSGRTDELDLRYAPLR